MTQSGAIRSILVIRLSAIGDIVLTTPLLTELQRACPQARIDYCTKAPFASLVAANPAVTSVITPESIAPGSTYDLVVDLQNNRRSHALLRKVRAGAVRRYRKSNWKKLLLVRFRIDLSDGYRSVVERYGAALEGFVPRITAPCALYPSAEDRAFAAAAIGSEGPVLAVCFGATHFTKRYPPLRFARIIGQVCAATQARVLLAGGKEDEADAATIVGALPEAVRNRVHVLAGKATLMQSAALLAASSVVLCNDTGLMHMAAASCRKLFVIFGSSVSDFGFLPWGAPFELFETEGLACRPCSHIGRATCPKGHFRCMSDISPERIAARIIETFKHAYP